MLTLPGRLIFNVTLSAGGVAGLTRVAITIATMATTISTTPVINSPVGFEMDGSPLPELIMDNMPKTPSTAATANKMTFKARIFSLRKMKSATNYTMQIRQRCKFSTNFFGFHRYNKGMSSDPIFLEYEI